MPRPLRIQASELHYHVIVRCNNGAYRFETAEDFSLYLEVLRKMKQRHQFKLFNYELMNSHVHLFLQPSEIFSLQKTMQMINSLYATDYNRRKKRKGHFWIGRYKSIPVDSDKHSLDLMRYMNRNPFRAGMVQSIGHWPWSGYRFYAEGEKNDLLEMHPSYVGLGPDNNTRRLAYKRYVSLILPGEDRKRSDLSETLYIGLPQFGTRFGLRKDNTFY